MVLAALDCVIIFTTTFVIGIFLREIKYLSDENEELREYKHNWKMLEGSEEPDHWSEPN